MFWFRLLLLLLAVMDIDENLLTPVYLLSFPIGQFFFIDPHVVY